MEIKRIVVSSEGTIPLGDYKNWKPTLTLEAELAPDDDATECTRALQAQANQMLSQHVFDVLMAERETTTDLMKHVPKDMKSQMLALPAGTHWVNVLNPRILPNQRWTKFPSRRAQFLKWAEDNYGMVAEDVITALNETNDLQDAESLNALEEFIGEEFEAVAAVVAKSVKYDIDALSKVEDISENVSKKAAYYCKFLNDPLPF